MSKRILVFDDNTSILEVIQEVLLYDGFVVDAVTHMPGFQHRLSLAQPDLIVLDYKLGDYCGLEICRYLKAEERTKDVPVIICSAYVTNRDSLKECGCDACLPKPFDIADLLDMVHSVLNPYQAN